MKQYFFKAVFRSKLVRLSNQYSFMSLCLRLSFDMDKGSALFAVYKVELAGDWRKSNTCQHSEVAIN